MDPPSGSILELLFGDFKPEVGLNLVHVKVILGIRNPQPNVLAVEGGKGKLR